MRAAYLRDEFRDDTTPETRHIAAVAAGTEHFATALRFYDRLIATQR